MRRKKQTSNLKEPIISNFLKYVLFYGYMFEEFSRTIMIWV